MSLFATPPAPPRADLNLDRFFGGGDGNDHDAPFMQPMLPAEWHPQSGVQLTWPHARTDWAPMLAEVTECYVRLAYEIALRETLLIVAPDCEPVQALLRQRLPARIYSGIRWAQCPTNDTWARDHGALTVIGPEGISLLDYRFDGWGGKFAADLDNAITRHLCDADVLHGSRRDMDDFTLEGGSIESDGEGTLLTTSTCLLNPNRNAALTKAQIEERLCRDLGMKQVLWLDHGHLEGDDTDAHIDTLARFCPDGVIAYVACDETTDSHYAALRRMEEQLRTMRNLRGEPYRLVPLPMPRAIYDEDGERLPATYANFLIMNGAVLYPTYAQPDRDEEARLALQRAFPHTDLVGIDCRALIRQHGSLHCATMQFPLGVIS